MEEDIGILQSLVPVPVYWPATGQLKLDVELALQRFDEESGSHICVGDFLYKAYAMVFLDRRDEALAMFLLLKEEESQKDAGSYLHAITCIETGILLSQRNEREAAKAELEFALQLAEAQGDLDDEFFQHDFVERAKYELGWLLLQDENYIDAVSYLESGLNDFNGDIVHKHLGVAYARMEAFDKALEHFKACIKMGGDCYTELGDTYTAAKNYNEAIKAYCAAARKASQSDMRVSESYNWLCAGSVTAECCQDYEQAAQYLISSLKATFRIQDDPELQSKRLLDTNTWLRMCINKHDDGNDENYNDNSAFSINYNPPDLSPKPLRILKAEGYGLLGASLLLRQSPRFEEVDENIENAINLVTHGFEAREVEKMLMFWFHWLKAEVQYRRGDALEALEIYQQCRCMAPTEKYRLKCELRCCFAMKMKGEAITSIGMFNQLEMESAKLLETEWALKAEMLLGLGQCQAGIGNISEAIKHLEAARKIWEDRKCFRSSFLLMTYSMLFSCYVENRQFSTAFSLVASSDILTKYHKGGRSSQLFQLFVGSTSRLLGDYESSMKALTDLFETQEHHMGWRMKCITLCRLADAYRNVKNFEAALSKYEEALEMIPKMDDRFAAQVYRSRAECYQKIPSNEKLDPSPEFNKKALVDYDRALEIFEKLGGDVDPRDLAIAYAGQAVCHYHLDEFEAAVSKLERAADLAGKDELLDGKIKLIRAHILAEGQGSFEESVSEARQAALVFANIQMKLKNLESAWVTLLEGDMKHIYFFLQEMMQKAGKFLEGLLWAERSRMRLYFHRADQQAYNNSKVLEPSLFDEDDAYATDCIAEGIKGCGQGSVVVEYTYSPDRTSLYIYVLHSAQELSVNFKHVLLVEFFSVKENKALGGNLDALIRRTRTEILRKNVAKATLGLGIIYRLLLQPVWEQVESNSTIIFAPQGIMSLIPFAALYDHRDGQFLVEKKNVGVIPSVRTLRRCQVHEERFQQAKQDARTYFVAGDPEPMGLNLPQLPSARSEAVEIARQLGVAPVVGSAMTKEAVIQGLTTCGGIVVLGTHGLVNSTYTHGALVMRGDEEHSQVDINQSANNLHCELRSVIQQQDKRSDQVLTAKEIEELDTGIKAGLVVLSACQTGEGAVSSEGVLGLGRAVLQAGASCAIVTLWEVDDMATKELMTGMFEELSRNRQASVVQALRLSMLKLLASGKHICMWASAVALGSPTLTPLM